MANPTTNYGFVLPTSTDLVTDLPADFDVALQGVDTRLKALQPGTTTGDLFYASAVANTNTRLGIGSAAQVLTVASGVPSWATPAGGGGMTSIASGSLSGSSLSLTSISGSYKNLQLVLRNAQTSASVGYTMRINNNTTSVYSQQMFWGTGSTSSNVSEADRSSYELVLNGSAATSPIAFVADFTDYTNTTSLKMINAQISYIRTAGGKESGIGLCSVRDDNAVTRIDFILSSGTFSAGTYILYGVS